MVKRPFDPRRLMRPIRFVVLAVALVLLWRGLSGHRVVTIPDGKAAVLDVAAGQSVVVRYYGARLPPSHDDVAIYVDPAGEPRYGRLVAFVGDALEVDVERSRLRRDPSQPWRPAPPAVLASLPLSPGRVLVLADDVVAAELGAVVPLDRLVARVVVPLPW